MPCFTPLKGWKAKTANSDGKRPVVFDRALAYVDRPVTVPCGQCIGCRLERSRQWAMRCLHEAQMHEDNSFITLTYDDEHLPENRSLDIRHFQLFMKRLRKKIGVKIRFYHCGEYGENFGRPHYHACLFGYDFPDKTLWKKSNEMPLYRSELLEGLWTFGYSSIGRVTFESAAYVARYIMKKITGDRADTHYEWICPETGEIFERKPEYTTMSRRPGIGRQWLDAYHEDVYPEDFVVIKGKKMRPPKYYDAQFEIVEPKLHRRMKSKRIITAKKRAGENTPARLKVRQSVQEKRLQQLPRNLE